jgi:hypothetical protein
MMPIPETDELKAYLDQLIEAARTGLMVWVEINPTTFVWDSKAPVGRLSLQRVERNQPTLEKGVAGIKKSRSYLLQAFEGLTVQRLSLSSSNNPELNSKLETLYEVVKTELTRRDLDFLKSLLPRKDA